MALTIELLSITAGGSVTARYRDATGASTTALIKRYVNGSEIAAALEVSAELNWQTILIVQLTPSNGNPSSVDVKIMRADKMQVEDTDNKLYPNYILTNA